MSKVEFAKPNKLSVKIELDSNKFYRELANAHSSLGYLEGSQRSLRNPSLLISPLTAKEATESSRIEGTQSTVSDVLLFDAVEKGSSDTQEVLNYRKTMEFAMNAMNKGRDISESLIKEMHAMLLKGVRHNGEIGRYRTEAVWIAEKKGDPIEKAIYIPPEHLHIQELMNNLLEFIKNSGIDPLVKAAIVHYQFEAIHPFQDGNGRMGRLLIPLILCKEERLTYPIVYISGYFEKNRKEYIDNLHRVDTRRKYEDWISFFCKSISEQLKETQSLVNRIYSLYENTKIKYISSTKSTNMLPFIDFIFKYPYFTITQVKKEIGVLSRVTVLSIIGSFEGNKEIIKTDVRVQRGAKVYLFVPLLTIIQ